MQILNEFKDSHHYFETYEKSDYYCPSCGVKGDLWEEQGGGDYYQGVDYICTSCESLHHLDNCGYRPTEENFRNKVRQLKSGVMDEPTTRRGS
jgi:hypothetical protein